MFVISLSILIQIWIYLLYLSYHKQLTQYLKKIKNVVHIQNIQKNLNFFIKTKYIYFLKFDPIVKKNNIFFTLISRKFLTQDTLTTKAWV
jgi:hypothetical protein